jgi:hypothetical protein
MEHQPGVHTQLCAVCGSGDHRGELSFVLPGESRSRVHRLCSPCFGLLRAAITAPGDGHAGGNRPLPRPGDESAAGLATCAICRGHLDPSLLAPISLMPVDTAFGPVLDEPEQPLMLRACGRCHAWTHDLLEEERIAGQAVRAFAAIEEGPAAPGGLRCLSVGVPPLAATVLTATIESLGGTVESVEDWEAFSDRGQMVFAWAGARFGEAAERLSESILERTVVITRPGDIQHAVALMRAGAQDLLVAPLSRQQILGALDRMGDSDAAAGR